MALVDDHVAEVVGAEPVDEVGRGRALDAREYVVPLLWLVRTIEHLAERRILHRVAERLARLVEELVAMGEEQQSRRDPGRRELAHVVEGSDDGLTRAGRRHDEVAASAVDDTLGNQLVEDDLLERQRMQRYEERVGRGRRLSR